VFRQHSRKYFLINISVVDRICQNAHIFDAIVSKLIVEGRDVLEDHLCLGA